MAKFYSITLTVLSLLSHHYFYAQNNFSQWCFGTKCGISFTTPLPSIYSSSITAQSSCASIADQNGNLMFYCNGDTVWNKFHQAMANGNNIAGVSIGVAMTAMILPQPGNNNLYYLFTCGSPIGPDHYCYSIIDMNLASNAGSVTAKNIPLWQPPQNAVKLASTKHCNGQDYWIVLHEGSTSVFHSYLLSAAGLNTVPIISVQGYTLGGASNMKISPNGKKIAFGNTPPPLRYIAIHDFDNSTGAIGSNSVILTDVPGNPGGLEFSSDGTKLYATNQTGGQDKIWQWDLCAGNQSAIAASVQTISVSNNTTVGLPQFGQFQLAPDGKIYIARGAQPYLSVINNPNNFGLTCNFNLFGLSMTPNSSSISLPIIPTHAFRNIGSFFTNTINCSNVQFTAPQHVQSTNGCAAIGPTILGTKWNFGDPVSAAQNTSSALNPSHVYSTGGTFTAYLVVNYPCYTDTFKQAVVIANPSPSFSITGKNSNCKNVTQTLSVSNSAYSYSWTSLGTTTSLVISPSITTVYSVVATNTVSGCTFNKTFTVNVNPCLGLENETGTRQIILFPNPSGSGIYQIQSQEEITMIQVFDSAGKLMLQKNGEGLSEIDLSSQQNGLYFLKLYSEGHVYARKLLLE